MVDLDEGSVRDFTDSGAGAVKFFYNLQVQFCHLGLDVWLGIVVAIIPGDKFYPPISQFVIRESLTIQKERAWQRTYDTVRYPIRWGRNIQY